jgi:hypothetical protein
MKKFVFTFAFMLIGFFTFANSNCENPKLSEVLENQRVSDDIAANFDNLAMNNPVFIFNGKQLSHSELISLKDCTLKGKFTITFSDGTKYSWEGTLTIVGQSCAEFLKEMMSDDKK